jgi:hypothetical protein
MATMLTLLGFGASKAVTPHPVLALKLLQGVALPGDWVAAQLDYPKTRSHLSRPERAIVTLKSSQRLTLQHGIPSAGR